MPTEPDTEALQAILRRGPPLRLAVLFGSGARGELRPDSDLDIGIVPEDPDLPLAAELDLQLELGAAAGRPIDVVRLDRASTLLRGQVARDARLLLEGQPGAFLAFRVRATVEYLDFLPLYDEVAERFRQTLIRQAESPK